MKKKEEFKQDLLKFYRLIQGNEMICFQDETSLQLASNSHKILAEKGSKPVVQCLGGRARINVFGIINSQEGTLFTESYPRLNAVTFQQFLEHFLASLLPDQKIYLVVDNARAHHAVCLQSFLEQHQSQLELLYLPPYSPELNPIERFWQYLKQESVYNTGFSTLVELEAYLAPILSRFRHASAIIQDLTSWYL